MGEPKKFYPLSFKMQVLSDYFASGCNRKVTARRWNIPPQALLRWERSICINEKKVVSLQSETKEPDTMEPNQPTVASLQEEINNLKKSLEYERMRVVAYERLIEIVKEEDGIDLLKKGGAKQ